MHLFQHFWWFSIIVYFSQRLKRSKISKIFSLPHPLHKWAFALLWVIKLKTGELSCMSGSSGSNYIKAQMKVPPPQNKTNENNVNSKKGQWKKMVLNESIFTMWPKKHILLWPKWMDNNEINYPLLSKRDNLVFSYLVTYGKRWGFLSVLISQSAPSEMVHMGKKKRK